jgi:hypothetical protein
MRGVGCACLGLALLAAGCKSSRSQGPVFIDPALLSLVPADTIMLAGARIDSAQKSQIYTKHLSARKLPMLDEFAAQTGIDPRRDIWQALAVSNGKHTALLVRGRFSEMGMEPRINIEGAERIPYKGGMIIGRSEGAVTFVNPTTAIAGRADAIMHIIDQRDKAALSTPLAAALRTVPGNSQFWMVALGGQDSAALGIPQEGNLANLAKIYSSLQFVMLSAELSSGISVHGKGTAGGEEDAKRLATALKGMIGLGRLNTPDNRPDLLRIFDAIVVEQRQSDVTVDALFPEELVDKLIAMLPADR